MLRELSIKNFAIIDDLKISFFEGLTILSGETGAGKSIIVNAINFLLGSRVTAKIIRDGSESAEIEALFPVDPQSPMAAALAENDIDASDGLLIRRIISQSNRHKIYINGHLATTQMLTGVTQNLASISGQHAHQRLLVEEQHLFILDEFGGLTVERKEVSRLYHEMIPLIQKLKDLESLQGKQTEHLALLRFQKEEIEAAAFTPDEDTLLEQEKVRLKNGEALYRSVYDSIQELYSNEGAVTERLLTIKKNIEKACQFDPKLQAHAEGLSDAIFRVEDITLGLRDYLKHLQTDEHRLEDVENRLDFIGKLKRKYGESITAITRYLESIGRELLEVETLSDRISETKSELSRGHEMLAQACQALSRNRAAAAERISKAVEKELASLRMTHTKFKVSLQPLPADHGANACLTTSGKMITESGIDLVSFLFSPNVGEALKPLASIASGGELSRVVLALKAIMAETDAVGTIVFDEVDAGIGGEVAEVVGKKLMALSRRHQVICITHLAQIAKFGDHHYKISKHVSGGRTKTGINRLTDDERVDEIARMIGGEKITPVTVDHAREMLASRVKNGL